MYYDTERILHSSYRFRWQRWTQGFRHRCNRKTRCTQRQESVHTFQDTEGERTTHREDSKPSHFRAETRKRTRFGNGSFPTEGGRTCQEGWRRQRVWCQGKGQGYTEGVLPRIADRKRTDSISVLFLERFFRTYNVRNYTCINSLNIYNYIR